MLNHIPNVEARHGRFTEILDTFVSILLVFGVDMFYFYVSGATGPRQALSSVGSCLDRVGQCVNELTTGDLRRIDIRALQQSIKLARHWEGEVKQGENVWTSLWEDPYRIELGSLLLDHCDAVYVALFSIQACSRRCGNTEVPSKIVKEVLDKSISDHCKLHARATHALLTGDGRSLQRVMAAQIGSMKKVSGSMLVPAKISEVKGNTELRLPDLCYNITKIKGKDGKDKKDGATDEKSKGAQPAAGAKSAMPEKPDLSFGLDKVEYQAAANAVRISAIALHMAVERIASVFTAETDLLKPPGPNRF